MRTTVGKLLLEEAIPEELRAHDQKWDQKGVRELLERVARSTPDKYHDILHKLESLGVEVATTFGRQASLSAESLEVPEPARKLRDALAARVQDIHNSAASPENKNLQVMKATAEALDPITKAVYEHGIKTNNPFALQVQSGARGNKDQLRALLAGDLLVADHKDEPIPIPILHSYAEGLDPAEFWISTAPARHGAIKTKFATPTAGYLSKILALASHRLVVTQKDCGTEAGIPVPASDPDNYGAVLARPAGGVAAGTVITPEVASKLGEAKIVVRSPITCQAEQGVCARCSGIRESGKFPAIGSNVGITASQAITEVLSQASISSKHGVALKRKPGKQGLDLINQLVTSPRSFREAAASAEADGVVDRIEDAPQGGKFVTVGNDKHWVAPEQDLIVSPGDKVEAGDPLSSGIPNPYDLVRHKGVGEGRLRLMNILGGVFRDAGMTANRRNLEPVARGLINHVRITDPDGPADTLPDDIVEYDGLAAGYKPRHGAKSVVPADAVGLHLERPALHYSIGTRVTPSVVKTLTEHGIGEVTAHPDPPSFAPEMTRAMETLAHSDDVLVRMGGLYGVRRSTLAAVHRGADSQAHSTSYMPALAQGVEFGKSPDGIGY